MTRKPTAFVITGFYFYSTLPTTFLNGMTFSFSCSFVIITISASGELTILDSVDDNVSYSYKFLTKIITTKPSFHDLRHSLKSLFRVCDEK